MSGGDKHYGHVVRVASLFAGGFLLFIIARSFLIPADFGVYGFFRAGALDDARAIPMKYVGQGTCVTCHYDIDEARQSARHAKVSCEACHGPAAAHIEDYTTTPVVADARALCVRCHTSNVGKPAFLPTVVPDEHAVDLVCTDCHNPHKPSFD